jgi:hypothetical protein
MISENLLATYSLLSFIQDSQKVNKDRSILQLFIPIVQETLNWMLYKKTTTGIIMGKSTLEIRDAIKERFELEIPPVALDSILTLIDTDGNRFVVNSDKSFIIKTGYANGIDEQYSQQKKWIYLLKKNYKAFCNRENVDFDFQELITFIQDQRNRIFEGNPTQITDQNYYVSKFVAEKIRLKDKYFNTICNIYLGGIITSYLSYTITERVMDTELLLDTNFYISLCNLNTEESYETCRQLFEIARNLGFRFSILQKTIEQIRILLTNRIKYFDLRSSRAVWDESDIHAACVRRKIESSSDLQLYKDSIMNDLTQKGINVIHDAMIKPFIDKASNSEEYRSLKAIRRNSESALNDVIAQAYVEHKRSSKKIAEFSDVNCWFLTNSTSFNKHELEVPVWQRRSINAADLLLLLWYANPSLDLKNTTSMLAISSLSANILRYRSEKCPTAKIVDEIQHKVAKLQTSGLVTQEAIAKLCIRMSEGCIDETEANRLVSMPTSEFVEYVEHIRTSENAYFEIEKENEDLRSKNASLNKDNETIDAKLNMKDMQLHSVLYIMAAIVIYMIYWFFIRKQILIEWLNFTVQIVYWIITCVLMNFINHGKIWLGLKSFFSPNSVVKKIVEEKRKLPQ